MASAAVGGYSARRAPIISLLTANVVSLTGSTLSALAVPWFVLITTGSAAKTGITGAVSILPVFIAGVFGGTLVDRLGFKRTSVLADLASGCAIALIPILYLTVGLAFWELLLLLFVARLLSEPGDTGRRSLTPDVAGLADMPLERANSLYSSAFSFSNLLGPVLAGVLIAAIGASNVLFVDAATFVVSAALIGLFLPDERATRGASERRGTYFADLREGFVVLRQNKAILYVALAAALANFTGVALFVVILPVYATKVLGGSVDLGLVIGADGAGALAGALLYGTFARRLPKRATFIGAFMMAGVAMMWMTALPGVVVVMALMLISGLATGPLNPMLQTVLQERIPQGLLGRVFGLVGAVAVVAAPLGALSAGVLLELGGLRLTIFLDTGLLLVVALVLFLMPALRELD
ncbi:MAG: MFS transporter [Nitrolancea sp.]